MGGQIIYIYEYITIEVFKFEVIDFISRPTPGRPTFIKSFFLRVVRGRKPLPAMVGGCHKHRIVGEKLNSKMIGNRDR